MYRSLTNTEFFAYEGEVWYRRSDSSIDKLRESDSEILAFDTSPEDCVTKYTPACIARPARTSLLESSFALCHI